MSLASRLACLFSLDSKDVEQSDHIVRNDCGYPQEVEKWGIDASTVRSRTMSSETDEEEGRPPYFHCMIAGGFGGMTGDLLMHPLDTVKTRQQGDPRVPARYTTMLSSFTTILRQEGIRKGLYGGWAPALIGSLPGTVIFFGTYEYCKRHMIDFGITPQLSYLASGFLGDFAASFVYVPSEVLKTRLQLQGRYNNPFFHSGYNYKSTAHALKTIVRQEGFAALIHGYKATILRDLPFSAFQFTFYEQGQIWARRWKQSRAIGLPLELLTGAAAGGVAGILTCPLDVVKTRIQTQVNIPAPSAAPINKGLTPEVGSPQSLLKPGTSDQRRSISTSSPSTHTPRPGSVSLETSSILMGLRLLYKTEGISGWFRGLGPRFVWTSVQSGCMLFLYQSILRQLEKRFWANAEDSSSF